MNVKELVTVIIPTFNRALVLKNAMKSVLAQSHSALELLIIDDGSTDNTKEIVAEFEDDRIRYYYQRNKGVSAARNFGISRACGELIAFLDSDDEWLLSKLEKQVEALTGAPSIGLMLCNCTYIDSERNQISVRDRRVEFPEDGMILGDVLKSPYFIPSTVLVYKKYLLEAGCFDEKLKTAEDMDLFLKLASFVGVGLLEEFLVLFMRENGGLGDSECSYRDHVFVIKKHLSLNNGLEQNIIKKSLYNCYLSFARGMALQLNYSQFAYGCWITLKNVSSISDVSRLVRLVGEFIYRILNTCCGRKVCRN